MRHDVDAMERSDAPAVTGHLLRVRGTVQGVGFRPHVARVARDLGVAGWVRNDGDGVIIGLLADEARSTRFRDAMLSALPPLARVDVVEAHRGPVDVVEGDAFRIVESAVGPARTDVAPDAAICESCRDEILDPSARRHRYPFTNCTHCGPRHAIVTGVPYDRARTTMRGFTRCASCQAEFDDPLDRRFHAQPIACPACGPRVWLERADGGEIARPEGIDALDAAATLLGDGAVVAAKGLGGFHLLCDATNADAVRSLRARKRRDDKPLAVMARDLDVVRRHASVDDLEVAALRSREAPIVLLRRAHGALTPIVDAVAPGLREVGFMLPATPMQVLLMQRLDRPLVCTSGNLSDEPTAIDDDDARARLAEVADWFLLHDRPIARRLDDSLVRVVDGAVRVLRRARGYAPAAIAAPPGFERAPRVLALGGQLKSTVCILDRGRAIPSQHLGDLDDLRAWTGWRRELTALSALFDHAPEVIAVDAHPGYRSALEGHEMALARGVSCESVQHHHAHIAACMFEHGRPLDGEAVLGIALDGVGHGDDGTPWGFEVLVARYDRYTRVGSMKPVALPGGDVAAREPWRNLYAHLVAGHRWRELVGEFGAVPAVASLARRPLATVDAMIADAVRSPRASSAGRLFDAAAAALEIRFDRASYEGQAAMELEALVTPAALDEARATEPYPVDITDGDPPRFEPRRMWTSLLSDLLRGASRSLVAARVHRAVAGALRRLALRARRDAPSLRVVALSGGVFQNRVLLEETVTMLRGEGLAVWTHARLPPNDGCLSVGQAAVTAARRLASGR